MIALLRMIAGLIWWAIGFSALYALHGLGCAAGWDHVFWAGVTVQRAALLSLWALFVAGGVGLLWWLRPHSRDLLDQAGGLLAWVGLVATIVGGWPILTIPACL